MTPSAERYQPVMQMPQPETGFERLLARGVAWPGALGHTCHRKLSRRYKMRTPGAFEAVVADLRPGDLCIDLGANYGEITQALAATGADVIAFEPDPDTFAQLQAKVGHLPNVTLHQKAAGARAETLTLHRAKNLAKDPAKRSQAASLIRQDSAMDSANTVEVAVVDFVAFLRALDRPVRLLKVDIEGSEFELLEHLFDDPVLDRLDTVFVETHERFDPARFNPIVDRLRARAIAVKRPYINLFWG